MMASLCLRARHRVGAVPRRWERVPGSGCRDGGDRVQQARDRRFGPRTSVGTMPLTTPPKTVSFLGAPVVCDPAEVQARFAFLGMPFGVPYDMEGIAPRSSGGPDAVRAATRGFYGEHDRYDFDLGGPMSADGWLSLVDCGNVAGDPYSVAGYAARATNYVHDLVAAGATPLVVGGDHSIPPSSSAVWTDAGS